MSERDTIEIKTSTLSPPAWEAFERINLHLAGINMADAMDALALTAGVLLEYARQISAQGAEPVELETLLADYTAAVRAHALANRGGEYGKPGAA